MIIWNEQNFLKTYRGTEQFITGGEKYYKLFLELLENEKLLSQIRFANDVLNIPPLKTFILYEREYSGNNVFTEKLPPYIKKGFGACFGYLYKFIYGGYDSEQSWFNDLQTGIKTASFFKRMIR